MRSLSVSKPRPAGHNRLVGRGDLLVAVVGLSLLVATVPSAADPPRHPPAARPEASPSPSPAQIKDWVRSSTVIFRGTVTRVGVSTTSSIPASEHTAVVRVAEVIEASPVLRLKRGEAVTLLALEKPPLRAGQTATFFAAGGEPAALEELGRSDRPAAVLRPLLTNAQRAIADEDLQARLAGAALVVIGRVSEIRGHDPTAVPPSQRDPQWNQARLEVATVLAGSLAERAVVVLFPGSSDVAWRSAPRFRVRQDGVWILRLAEDGIGFTALDPLDYRPLTDMPRVRRLLKPASR